MVAWTDGVSGDVTLAHSVPCVVCHANLFKLKSISRNFALSSVDL